MWEFKNKKVQRHHKIFLDYFIFDKDLNAKDLSVALDCDLKTVKNTINDMNNLYIHPHLYFDEKTNLLQSQVIKGTFENKIINEFFDNNLEFKLLEYLFLFSPVTEEEILRDLYISHSTLQRNIVHLKKNLNKYELDITPSPFSIVGDELILRNFFLQYYTEKNDCGMFLNFNLYQQTIFNLFKNMTNQPGYAHLTPIFTYFLWVIFIASIRISKGYLIEDQFIVPEFLLPSIKKAVTPEIKSYLSSIFSISNLSGELLSDYLYFFFPSNHSINLSNESDQKEIDKLYTSVLETYNISIDDTYFEKISYTLYQYLLGYYAETYFLFDTKYYQFLLLQKDYPKSMNKLYDLVESSFDKFTINNNESIYSFILLIIKYTPHIYQSFNHYETKLNVNLLLLSEETKISHIHTLLTHRFKNFAEFHIVNQNYYLSENTLQRGVWISNIATINRENVLHIDDNLIYSSLPYIESFLKTHH